MDTKSEGIDKTGKTPSTNLNTPPNLILFKSTRNIHQDRPQAGLETSLDKFRIEIIHSLFSDPTEIKLEINNKNVSRKS